MIQSVPQHLASMMDKWACVSANETGSQVFIDDVTADAIQIQSNTAN